MIHFPITSPSLIPSLSDSSHHSFDDPLSPVQRSLSPVGRSKNPSFDVTMVEDITGKITLEKVSAIKTTAMESSACSQAEDLNALFLGRQVSNGAELPSTPKVGSLARSALDSNETAAEMEETIPTSSVPPLDSSSEPNTSCVVEVTKSKKRKKKSEGEVGPRTFSKKKREQHNFLNQKINALISLTLEHHPNPLKTVIESIADNFADSRRANFISLYNAVVDCLAWEAENNAEVDTNKIKKISRNKVSIYLIKDTLTKARIPENRVAFQSTKKRAKTTQKKSEVMESVASSKADLNPPFLERQASNGAELPSTSKVDAFSQSAFDSNEEAAEMIAKELVNWRSSFTLVDDETIPTSSAHPLDSSSASDIPVVESKKSKKRKKKSEDGADPKTFNEKIRERHNFLNQKINALISLTLKRRPDPLKTVMEDISTDSGGSTRRFFKTFYNIVVDCLAWETENNAEVDTDKIKEISQNRRVSAYLIKDTLTKARIPENRVAFQSTKKRAKTTQKTSEVMESAASSKADLNPPLLRQVSNEAKLPSASKMDSFSQSAANANEEAAEMIAKELVNWRSSFTLVDDETIPTSSAHPLDSSSASDIPVVESKKRNKKSEDGADPDKTFGKKKRERAEFLKQQIDELITHKHHPNPFKIVAKSIASVRKDTRRECFRRFYKIIVDCLAWETENNMMVDADKIKEISHNRASVDQVKEALAKARIPENRVAFQSTKSDIPVVESKKRNKKSEDKADPDKTFREKPRELDKFLNDKIDELISRTLAHEPTPFNIVANSISNKSADPRRERFRQFYKIIVACLAWETENNALVDKNKIKEISEKRASVYRVEKALERARMPENRVAFQSIKPVKPFDAEERNKFFDAKIDELIAAKHLPDPVTTVANSISNKSADPRRTRFNCFYKIIVDCLAWEIENNTMVDADKIKKISHNRVSVDQIKEALTKARIPENRVVFQSTKQRVETTKKKSEVMESSASSKSEQATIAQKQGASENQHSDARLTLPESDSAGYSGIDKLLNEQLNNRN